MGDYNRNAETNAITITPDPNSQEAFLSSMDQNIWATEDDYSNCENPSETFSNSSYDGGRQAQSRSASDQPPNKKPRITQGDSQVSAVGGSATTSRSRAIGKMFFKTKLCCKFRAGTCPYITNCNFAHGIEELRKPPPNWQEIVASQDDGSGISEFKEEPQQAIPIVLSSSNNTAEVQRSYKGRHCKKFYTEEGCPYGDVCTFMHDEQSKSRESVAINLGPTTGIGPAYGNEAAGLNQKPSNWKTRICNKWEMTGYCPFGSKCHFAHGATELHRYGGGLVEMDGRDNSSAGGGDSKQSGVNGGALSSKPLNDTAMTTTNSMMAHTDIYHLGVSSQRQAVGGINPRQGQRPLQKWKGPNKISMIYGDWIVEND